MHRLKFRVFLLLFCAAQFVVQQQSHAVERKQKVLVLHSYHQGLEWTDNVTQGIQDVFKPYAHKYEIHYEYLDTKRNTSLQYKEQLLQFYLARNRNVQFEAVIVSDNNALSFILEHRNSHFDGIPIIFCGINHYSPSLLEGTTNITGVAEYTDYRSTLNVMKKLHPERNKVLVIVDRTATGDAVYTDLKALDSNYAEQLEFDYYRDFDLDELVGRVTALGDHDVIYLLTANRDKNNNFMSFNEAIHQIQSASSVPIYGSWGFYFGKGIIGGAITSGEQQGEEAAMLALRILHGESASQIKPVEFSPVKMMFDYFYIKKFGLSETDLPTGSTVINQPIGFFQRYKFQVYSLAGLFVFMSAFIILGYFRQYQTLVSQRELNEELDRRVKEKTASLELANKELERVSHRDGLTDLYNRGYFDQQLQEEWSRLRRRNIPLSMIMCDIDFFKNYNDTYGHVAGDECIQKVAVCIRSVCRRSYDFAARYGGEEFAIMLPQTELEEAHKLALELLNAVKMLSIVHSDSEADELVSVSIGVSTMVPSNKYDPTEIVHQADKAMYQSKEAGRNRVTLYRDA